MRCIAAFRMEKGGYDAKHGSRVAAGQGVLTKKPDAHFHKILSLIVLQSASEFAPPALRQNGAKLMAAAVWFATVLAKELQWHNLPSWITDRMTPPDTISVPLGDAPISDHMDQREAQAAADAE